jgi:hypothetical protein
VLKIIYWNAKLKLQFCFISKSNLTAHHSRVPFRIYENIRGGEEDEKKFWHGKQFELVCYIYICIIFAMIGTFVNTTYRI